MCDVVLHCSAALCAVLHRFETAHAATARWQHNQGFGLVCSYS